MEILFITPELSPMSGDGPVATVCAALPKALRGLDHRVTVLSPMLRSVDPKVLSLARRLSKLEFELAGERRACEIYDGRTPGGVDLVFVGHEELLHSASTMDDGDEATAALRAGVFAQACAEALMTREPRPDLVHAHDWVGALAIVAARERGATALPMVLTVHEMDRMGEFGSQHADALGLPDTVCSAGEVSAGGRLRVMVAGLRQADRVTTVSPTATRELMGSDHPLGTLLSSLGDRLLGIPSGVDASVWNALTDPILPARFDPMDQTGKARCKGDLQHALGLPIRDDIPLVGVLGTTAPTDGLDLLVKAAPALLRNELQCVVQLADDQAPRRVLNEMATRFPDRLKVTGPEDALRHRIVAASDIVLVAARTAAAALAHHYAHRYGALPVAPDVGALADSLVDCDSRLATGNAFLYRPGSHEDLLAAARRAVAAFQDGRAFRALSQRVMRIDASWDRSARLYDRLYREAVAGREGSRASEGRT